MTTQTASSQQEREQLAVQTIRTLSIDAVQKANSGHPGMPMGMADAAFVLWSKFLKHNPKHSEWVNRDRFVLSAGHGSMLLYSLLHLFGYDLSLDDLKQFRQWGSKTPGHPEYGLTDGVETTTGPLGQGFANGVGMAVAEQFLAATFNTDQFKLVDHHTYAIVSDGDVMEGISHEAASLAGHLKLGKLIYLYDYNEISIDGSTDLTHTEDVGKRFEGYGWQVLRVDGHDRAQVADAIERSQAETERPSLIICDTHIGFGSPNKQDSESSHGAPLGEEEVKLTKEAYNWPYEEEFVVPEEVRELLQPIIEAGSEAEEEWNELFEAYQKAHPEQAERFSSFISGSVDLDWESVLPTFETGSEEATRKSSATVINALSGHLENMIGGSADLAASNKTFINESGNFQPGDYTGRNIFYGVREHAMVSMINGMNLHGGLIPYGGTFLIFSDYCRPAIRLAGLMKQPTTMVFTHDSVGLGEDGPTHQPIEQLMSLRMIPNVTVIRPADAREVAYAWKVAIEHQTGPTLLALTRQGVPVLDYGDATPADLEKGAYVIREAENSAPEAILIASGSEVHMALEAQQVLQEEGIPVRVVSMPCWELFEAQSEEYKNQILPPEITNRVSFEAGSTHGWQRWIGDRGIAIGIDHFGESAPGDLLYEKFALTVEAVVEAAKRLHAES